MSERVLFTGNATPQLATDIARNLNTKLGKIRVDRFSDGEISVEILENVRGKDIYLIQSTCAPANDNLMELIVMADALRRASVKQITAVIPYFGYARQDRRVRSARVPITAKIVADMIARIGCSRVLTVDLHADQIQGFFHIPVDNVYASPVFLDNIRQRDNEDNLMVVSPDVGGVVRARAIAKRLKDSDLAIIDKRRPAPNETEIMHIIGNIKDRDCLIVDDMVDTAGTLCQAARALKNEGAASVSAYITHPILSGHAITNIQHSQLDTLVVTDTIPLKEEARKCDKIKVVSLAPMLAECIHRLSVSASISTMFE